MNTATTPTIIHPSAAAQVAWELNDVLARVVRCELWHRHAVATELPQFDPLYRGFTFAEIAADLVPLVAPHFEVAEVIGDARVRFVAARGAFPLPAGWSVNLTLIGVPALALGSRVVLTVRTPEGEAVATPVSPVQPGALLTLGAWGAE